MGVGRADVSSDGLSCSNTSVSSQHCSFCSRWSENLSLFCTLVLCEHTLDSLATACPSAHTACAVNFPPCLYRLEPCARLYLCMRSPRPTQVLFKGILHHRKRSSYVTVWASRGLRGGFVAVNTSIIVLRSFLYFCEKFCCDAHIQMSFKAPGLIQSKCFCRFSERERHKDGLAHGRNQCH